MNLIDLIQRFPTNDDCRAHLERIRWPSGVTCPRCGHDKITRLKSRRQFTCAAKGCRYRFSATSGTVMHSTKIPLQKWFLAIYLMSDARKGVSANQLHRELGISYQCCWHMCHRIREAMREDRSQSGLFRGIVQADEYYQGGRLRPEDKDRSRGRGSHRKVPILGAIERESGKIRTSLIPSVSGKTLADYLARWVDLGETELHTDEWMGYNMVGRMTSEHSVVKHGRSEYVSPDGVSTNAVENAWSLFARSVMGSFHKISVKHLPRYLAEFDSRFNARTDNGTYFPRILRQSIGRRLTMNTLVRGADAR